MPMCELKVMRNKQQQNYLATPSESRQFAVLLFIFYLHFFALGIQAKKTPAFVIFFRYTPLHFNLITSSFTFATAYDTAKFFYYAK